MNLIIICIAFQIAIIPVFKVQLQYSWAMGLLLDDDHLYELEWLDKSYATMRRELTIISESQYLSQ